MTEILIKAAQLILSLSLLVFVHELGHFGFARLFKVRVDKFYLFFNPKFSIFRAKKIHGKWQIKWFAPNLPDHMMPMRDEDGIPMTDKKGRPIEIPAPLDELDDSDWRKHPETTEWGIGWLPLGGYCKIAGMVDESMDATVINSEPQPWEYRSRPVWQRMFIITGGVLMNFITAIVIYSMMMFTWGKEYLPMDNAYMGYNYCQTALNSGFENGDRIISIDGEPIHLKQDVVEQLLIDGKRNVTVERHDSTVSFVLPEKFGQKMLESKEKVFMTERYPFVVENVAAGSPAAAANLQKGDSIVGINGKTISDRSDIMQEFAANKEQSVPMTVFRDGKQVDDTIAVNETGKIGVELRNPYVYFKTEREEYSFWSAIPAGWKLGVETLTGYVKQFKLVFTKAGVQSLGGFAAIGNLFPGQWSWAAFWSMTAFLSIILAFMNILPIPVLDGGYLLFLIYEMITRRKPSMKFMEISLNIGMFLLFGLLILANGNDLLRMIGVL